MNDLLFRVGETKRVRLIVAGPSGFDSTDVSAVALTLYSNADRTTPVLSAVAGSAAAGPNTNEVEVYYNWTPAAVGDYTGLLSYTVGGETLGERVTATVLPIVSVFDRYELRIIDLLMEHEVGEARALVSYRQLKDAVLTAVRRYSQDRPRHVKLDKSLTASLWEYDLSDDLTAWTDGFSQVLTAEYPVDATVQSRSYLEPGAVYVDYLRDRWGLSGISPSTGQSVRLIYTALHSLTDTAPAADTVPDVHFDGVCMWAAGLLLRSLSSRAVHSDAPSQGAEFVGYRDKSQQYASVAKAMLEAAPLLWRPVVVGL